MQSFQVYLERSLDSHYICNFVVHFCSGWCPTFCELSAMADAAKEECEMPPKPVYSKRFISVCLAANVALSISIILLNKAVYTHVGFPNMTLTLVHFVFTSLGMVLCRAAKLFIFKPLPLRHMIPVSMTFCGFVVLTNLSLQYNTVGTYQIIKTMTTPAIIVIQTYFYMRNFSTQVKLTLVISLLNYTVKFDVIMC